MDRTAGATKVVLVGLGLLWSCGPETLLNLLFQYFPLRLLLSLGPVLKVLFLWSCLMRVDICGSLSDWWGNVCSGGLKGVASMMRSKVAPLPPL